MTKQFLNPSSSTYIILFLFLFINEDLPRVALLTNSFLFQEFIYHHRCCSTYCISAPRQPKPPCHWFWTLPVLNTKLALCQGLLQVNNSSEVSHFKTSLQLISLPVTLSLWIDFEVLKVLCFSNVEIFTTVVPQISIIFLSPLFYLYTIICIFNL